MRSLAVILPAVFLTTFATAGDEPVFSGPQPGEKLASFVIKNVVADPAKDVNLIKDADGKPVLIAFVHKKTRPAFGLTNAIMRYAATRKKDGLTSGVVYLAEDMTAETNWMKGLSGRGFFPKGVTYGISPDGPEGPGPYGLNRQVEVTVLIGKEGRTTANFALVQPGLAADGPKIARALAEVLGDKEPADLVKFNEERMQAMRRPTRPAPQQRAATRLPAGLESKLRAVINKDNTPKQVDKAAEVVEELIKDDAQSRNHIWTITNRVIAGWKKNKNEDRWSTPRAREYIRKWAKEWAPEKRQTDKPAPPKKTNGDSKPEAKSR